MELCPAPKMIFNDAEIMHLCTQFSFRYKMHQVSRKLGAPTPQPRNSNPPLT